MTIKSAVNCVHSRPDTFEVFVRSLQKDRSLCDLTCYSNGDGDSGHNNTSSSSSSSSNQQHLSHSVANYYEYGYVYEKLFSVRAKLFQLARSSAAGWWELFCFFMGCTVTEEAERRLRVCRWKEMRLFAELPLTGIQQSSAGSKLQESSSKQERNGW